MYINRPFFGSRRYSKSVNKIIVPANHSIVFILICFLLVAVISKIGFQEQSSSLIRFVVEYHRILFTIIAMGYLLRAIICVGFGSYSFDFYTFSSIALFIILSISLNIDKNIEWLNSFYFYALMVFGLFLFELSRFDIRSLSLVLNPAQLFMLSFGIIVFSGALLLMLPKATTHPISFVNALFTSTSAVCVTGLTVLDTAKDFTMLGKAIILFLIQVGGIGIMTFTSFFGYFFKGSSTSFSEKFVLSDFLSEDNVSEIAKTFLKVILLTFSIEAIGTLFIFFSLDTVFYPDIVDRLQFAVFHSISAFCNAGFSTLSANIYDGTVSSSLPILYSISFLIIFGGIGFPILFNLYTYIKIKITSYFNLYYKHAHIQHIPKLININSKLVIYTTLFLLVVGTVFFYYFEKDNTLSGMSLGQKIAHSFFGSVTARTAGYNSVNYAHISIPTVVLTVFLMWVGASPVSTGGGIKTTTFAVAILNTLRIARSKHHIEFEKREIHERSVDRAFAIIILSIIILGCSSLLMYIIEPSLGALKILFECVSAFGTVGLSLGITPILTDASKILLIVLMFAGRMGILTILFAIFRKQQSSVYRFPKENIVIN